MPATGRLLGTLLRELASRLAPSLPSGPGGAAAAAVAAATAAVAAAAAAGAAAEAAEAAAEAARPVPVALLRQEAAKEVLSLIWKVRPSVHTFSSHLSIHTFLV